MVLAKARNLAHDRSEDKVENLLWVNKYKPTSLKTVIGQQGDQICANKFLLCLQNWHKDLSEDKKTPSLVNLLAKMIALVLKKHCSQAFQLLGNWN